MLWLFFAQAGYTPRPVADDGIQHMNQAGTAAPKFVFDRSARGDSSHECPKCGKSSDGKSNCCSEGGTWQGQCTLTLADGGQHTWSDGYDACDSDIVLHSVAPGKVAANCADWCSHWTVLAPECAGCQQGTNLAAGTAEVLAAGAAVPEGPALEVIQTRKCDSEREEWCDGAQIETALPPGGNPRDCTTFPDAHLPDSWCVENCGFPVPNCPKKMCDCSPKGDSSETILERARGKVSKKEKANLSPFAAAFERGRKSFDGWVKDAGDKKKQKEQESLFPNRFEERKNRFGVVLENLPMTEEAAPTRPCESQWDGNCDRSAFQGPNGLFSKKSVLVKKKVSEEDMSEDERKEWRRMHPDGVDWSAFNDWQNPKGGEDVLPEWQLLHKQLMKTDISGLPAEGDPTSCKAVSPAMSDTWCQINCGGSPPNCPSALCMCQAPKQGAVKKGTFGQWGRCPDCYLTVAEMSVGRTPKNNRPEGSEY